MVFMCGGSSEILKPLLRTLQHNNHHLIMTKIVICFLYCPRISYERIVDMGTRFSNSHYLSSELN